MYPVPSSRTLELWGSKAPQPFRLDVTVLAVALLTIPFSIWAGVYRDNRRPAFYYEDGFHGLYIAFDVLAPLLTLITSALSIYLYVTPKRALHPGLSVGISTFQFCWWAGGVLCVSAFEAFQEDDWTSPSYKAGTVKIALASLEAICYLIYMIIAGRALDKHLKAQGSQRRSKDAIRLEEM